MITDGKDETGGMNPGDDEALWALLGRQEPPAKAGPYFARRVLREIADEPPGGWWQRVRQVWTFAPRHTAVWSGAVAFGVLCLSAVLTLPSGRLPVAPVARVAVANRALEISAVTEEAPATVAETSDPADEAAPAQDVELIADLDNLLSREESRLWTEDDTGRF